MLRVVKRNIEQQNKQVPVMSRHLANVQGSKQLAHCVLARSHVVAGFEE